MNELFIEDLRLKLNKPLPGHEAHSVIMPERKKVSQIDEIKMARKSAVLLLLYPINGELQLVFIMRSTYKGVHSAQISFPGGKAEQTDLNLEATALREAQEELNIEPTHIDVLGKLSTLYVPPSNFIIHPFVGYQKTEPNFKLQEREVEALIKYPLDALLDSKALIRKKIKIETIDREVKGFLLNDQLLWGATAMITNELIQIIKRIKINTL